MDDKKIPVASELQILRNACSLMSKKWNRRTVNWAKVKFILLWGTNHSGSSSSIDKCRELGIDPWGYSLPASDYPLDADYEEG